SLGDLARDAEAEIGLDPRLDRADKGPIGGLVGVVDGRDEDRPDRCLRLGLGMAVAARQHRGKRGKDQKRDDGCWNSLEKLSCGGSWRGHGGLLTIWSQ